MSCAELAHAWTALSEQAKLKKDFFERGNGNYLATATDGKHVGKVHVARIKPYIVSRCVLNHCTNTWKSSVADCLILKQVHADALESTHV